MKRKGFTLIELMGVIVLIGVLSVITVPVVKNITKESKQKAFEKQKYTVVESAKSWAIKNTEELPLDDSIVLVDMSTLKSEGFLENRKIINPTNNREMNGCVVIRYKEDFNQCEYTYDENCGDANGLSKLAVVDQSLGVTSINSCVSNEICEMGTPFAIKVNDLETYKFYVIEDNGSEVTLIMDRNIVSKTVWIGSTDYELVGGINWGEYGNHSKGPITALDALESMTSGWTNIVARNYTLSDDSGENLYSPLKRVNARARMLTQTEANSLGCTTADNSCPSFLYENLGINNTDAAPVGYWLSTASSSDTYLAQFITHSGVLSIYPVNGSDNNGVRPVIKIRKNIIS